MNLRLHVVLYSVRFPIPSTVGQKRPALAVKHSQVPSSEISKEALPLWLVKSTGTKVINSIKDGISIEDHHC
ncbi:hypothetical protein JMJ77_0014237 [Colletotrichum scovillei]|uniref:Uncharacterized protein n=1 Tax=Colletotrichum scovillei TaxID=1209932 RepID=A0A9P7R337_9PEZI|nr:hypothetical protein JMJ77_0014237 [Colletotrichum scovillei]KAG7065761.1 hypothetical protein JMJ78_0012509 [Colletotrichum scovillei]KAG7068333.1 hypothetical protein JMJ76_0008024 [Colletotrichum scovillei]